MLSVILYPQLFLKLLLLDPKVSKSLIKWRKKICKKKKQCPFFRLFYILRLLIHYYYLLDKINLDVETTETTSPFHETANKVPFLLKAKF